jgi:competence protein ComEA
MVVRGGWLLLLLMLGLTINDLGWISFQDEKSPALRASGTQQMQVLIANTGGSLDGIHQINDAQQLIDVINLAGLVLPASLLQQVSEEGPFLDGKMLNFQVVNNDLVAVELVWMSAAKRMTLGIPLHVNRMSESDWQDLPGVGPSLALGIKNDRHKNGDYESIYALARVHGVGTKRIEKWKPFFEDN